MRPTDLATVRRVWGEGGEGEGLVWQGSEDGEVSGSDADV